MNSSKGRSDTQDLKVVKADTRPSVMTQVTMSAVDSDIFEVEFHALQKHKTKWKAFGYEIADSWASRNLWF